MSDVEVTDASYTRPVWSAALAAGAIASIAFLVLEMLLLPLVAGLSPWTALRMIAAIPLGQGVLPPPATFDAVVFFVALLLHLALSLLYALLFVRLLWRLSSSSLLLAGAAFGIVLYLVNFHVFTLMFPWFAELRGLPTLVVHTLFGLIVAWVYIAFSRLSTRRYPRGSA